MEYHSNTQRHQLAQTNCNGNANTTYTDPTCGSQATTASNTQLTNIVQRALQASSFSEAKTALVLNEIVDKLHITSLSCVSRPSTSTNINTSHHILPPLPIFDGTNPATYEAWRAQARAKLRQDGAALGTPLCQFDYLGAHLSGPVAARISGFLADHGTARTGTPALLFAFLDGAYGGVTAGRRREMTALLGRLTQEDEEPMEGFAGRFEAVLFEMLREHEWTVRDCFYRALRPEWKGKLHGVLGENGMGLWTYEVMRDALLDAELQQDEDGDEDGELPVME